MVGSNQGAPIIIDEVQKVPELLDEVHWLMENRGLRFVLCGSSARRLKRGHGNLLGGRGVRYELYPLVSAEVPDFSLGQALNRGLVPSHYVSSDAPRLLEAYVGDYLREEIVAEGVTRNIPAFGKFMEVAALSNGEIISFANIARECGVSAPTVRSYFEILEETLVGRFVRPVARRGRRRIVEAPRFYLFDVGVAGALARRGEVREGSELFGRAFEHFIHMELTAHAAYSGLHYPVEYCRTASGFEVDFVLADGTVAVEAKATAQSHSGQTKGLRAYAEEHHPRRSILVSLEPRPRLLDDGIEVMPWRQFLAELWSGAVVA
jgi:predicted AAA+ superfamily ATPase